MALATLRTADAVKRERGEKLRNFDIPPLLLGEGVRG